MKELFSCQTLTVERFGFSLYGTARRLLDFVLFVKSVGFVDQPTNRPVERTTYSSITRTLGQVEGNNASSNFQTGNEAQFAWRKNLRISEGVPLNSSTSIGSSKRDC